MTAAASPAPAASASPEPAPRPGFRARLMGGAAWSLISYGLSQVLRFASNLILTRLLFPEAFGLMALTQVFLIGLEMLSDVGLGPAIIQGRHGDDPRFLRTAWTVQVIRGAGIGLVAALIAWPVARIYQEPQLLWLLPVLGLGSVVRGFASIRLQTLHRHVRLARLSLLELGSQLIALVVTIVAAWLLRSVSALVLGVMAGAVAHVALSHLMLPGARDSFLWDPKAAAELAKVGRWVLFSTMTTFFVGHLDRLIMGRLLSTTELGVYTMALFLSTAVPMVGRNVGSRVLFPLLAETSRESPERLYQRLRKVRFLWTVPTCVALVVLSLTAEPLVRLLYRPAYHEAGWMLSLLAAGAIPAVVNQASGLIWPVLGEFRMITLLMLVQMPVLLGGMLLGYRLGGVQGLVAGIALVEVVIYPVQAALAARRGLWQPELDLPVFAVTGLALALGFWL